MILEDWPTIRIYKFTVLLTCIVNIVIQALFILTNLDVLYVVVLSSLFIVFYLITFFAAYYEHCLGVLLGGTGILLVAVFAFLKVPAALNFIIFLLMIAIIYGYAYLIWKKDNS